MIVSQIIIDQKFVKTTCVARGNKLLGVTKVGAAENFSDGNKVWHQIEMHRNSDCL